MNKLSYLLLVALSSTYMLAQSTDQNYVKRTLFKVPTLNTVDATNGGTVNVGNKTVTVDYIDGVGRAIQTVAHRQSASSQDIVTPIVYDAFGMQPKKYPSYPINSSSMLYTDNNIIISDQTSFYTNSFGTDGLYPFVEQRFEASPLNRLIEQGAQGLDWIVNPTTDEDHTVKYSYLFNIGGTAPLPLQVKLFKAVASWSPSLKMFTTSLAIPDGFPYHPYSTLYKNIIKDENWKPGIGNNHTTEEYRNQKGQVLLKRAFNNNINQDTYYVYDQFDNLSFVIPPMAASANITESVLNNLCYQYRYDAKNRLVEKKLPGKQWEYIVYDNLDRVVATGPTYSPFADGSSGWMITRYDVFNRIVYTGWSPSSIFTSSARQELQYNNTAINVVPGNSTVDNIAIKYAAASLPANFKLLTVSYYDDYRFLTVSPPLNIEGTPIITNATTITTKGLATGQWIRVLTNANSSTAEISYTLYDSKSRAIRNHKLNHVGGYTYTDTKLNFTGLPIYKIIHHKRTSSLPEELTVREDFIYTEQDRLAIHTHKINNAPNAERIVSNEYNKIGQLMKKRVGGAYALYSGGGLQKVDYTYNVRGWLKGINSVSNFEESGEPVDLFAFKINYNSVEMPNAVGTALFNGNISETYWKTYPENVLRKYSFNYDDLNRLLDAAYQKPGLIQPITDAYNESMEYDSNGNITHLYRTGYLDSNDGQIYPIDNLFYTYISGTNKLRQVDDQSQSFDGFKDGNSLINNPSHFSYDYDYDLNGNMTIDHNKGISYFPISYNHLNLPEMIRYNQAGNILIDYVYNAVGEKIQKYVVNAPLGQVTMTEYFDGFQYIDGVLQFFPTAEGYVSVTSGNRFNYVYNYKDHLGNVRLSYTKDGETLKVLEENHYYPFGMKHNYNTEIREWGGSRETGGIYAILGAVDRSKYQYKYNGKEFQDELSLNWYDYGARNYDPAIGRWMNIDPLAEQSRRWSPYNYAYNNPVFFVDPDGMQAMWKPDKNGNLVAEKGDNVATLAKFLGTSSSDVGKRFKKGGESIGTNHQFKEGDAVKLNNNVTRAIGKSTGGTVEDINAGKASQDVKNDNYICDECAQMATNGEEINPANAEKYNQFPNPVAVDGTPGFSQVDSFDNVKFNEGIASIGGEHTVSFYGKSKDGTVYVLTKDGREAKPQVLPLSQVISGFNKDQGTNFTMKDVKYYKKDESK